MVGNGNGNGSEGWFAKSLGGVNLITIMTAVVAVVWAFAQAQIGQTKADTRLNSIEKRFEDVTRRFDDLESQIDQLRSTNTEIAIMRLTGENTAAIVHRLESNLDSVKEEQRDLHSKIREIERRLPDE